MKIKFLALILILALAIFAHAATNDLTGLLQKGLFEEEANRDLTAAIANYQSLANAFDKDRQLAATAIFRLGECYRKLGKTNEAVVQYQRILKEFTDQQTLATLSRQNLAGLGSAGSSPQGSGAASSPEMSQALRQQIIQAEAQMARDTALLERLKKMDRSTLREALPGVVPDPQLDSLETQLNQAQQDLIRMQSEYGQDHPKFKYAREGIDEINRKIDERIDGILTGLRTKVQTTESYLSQLQAGSRDTETTRSTTPPASGDTTTDEEQTQIRNIQAMIQNSPDLINAPNGEGMTPLLLAAEKGQLIVAKYLLDHGADVNGLSRNHGRTPLCVAAENGHKAMVELLLARGADVSAGGLNPLYLAVSRGFTGVAQVLIANKANVNLVSGSDNNGMRPIHIAARDNKAELVQLLIAHGADVNVTTPSGSTPLELAAMMNSTAAGKLLLAAKATIDAKDRSGNTSLHEAARAGNTEMVSLLLNAGTAADPTNMDDATPLLLAVAGGRVEATRILLEHKADSNHRGIVRQWRRNQYSGINDRNWQPISFAVGANDEILKLLLDAGANTEGDSVDPNEMSPLFLAIDCNDVNSVQMLLEHGANPKRVEKGSPALNRALGSARDRRIIALLLDKGADPNATNANTWPALLLARDPETARLLIAHKADVNAAAPSGFTALMNATCWNTNCLSVLLDQGAQLDLHDINGNTALHYAASHSSLAAVELLLQHKANPNIQNKVGNTPLDIAKAGFGGSIPNSLISSEANIAPTTVSSEAEHKIAELLVQAGGLANLPKRDRIEVRRGADSIFTISKDSQGRNQISLLETIACRFGLLSRNASGEWEKKKQVWRIIFDTALRFPDFKKVVIYRRAENSAKQTVINVDVQEILNSGDCARDVWLQWGDVVEIPEADHPVDEQWGGLSTTNVDSLFKCLTRQVMVKIKGENTLLTLAPSLVQTKNMFAPNEYAWELTRPSFTLRSVLDNSKLIRVSSDLTRVKVTRADPATKKTTEWIVDCTDKNQFELWLRDGDVIEVPEK